MIAVTIAEDFKKAGVAVELGWITCAVQFSKASDALQELLRQEAAACSGKLKRAADSPAIAATRTAYKKLGKDPSRYRPAAEALTRRVLQGKALPSINVIIDINNLISLRSGISIGSYDRAKLISPLELRVAAPGERYEGIGRGELNLEGLTVMRDAQGAFGSPTSDSVRSMVNEQTREVMMIFYGLGTAVGDLLECRQLLADHAGATGMASGTVKP